MDKLDEIKNLRLLVWYTSFMTQVHRQIKIFQITIYQAFVWESIAKASEFTAILLSFWFGRFGASVGI